MRKGYKGYEILNTILDVASRGMKILNQLIPKHEHIGLGSISISRCNVLIFLFTKN